MEKVNPGSLRSINTANYGPEIWSCSAKLAQDSAAELQCQMGKGASADGGSEAGVN